MEELIVVARTFGVAVACLTALAFAVWRSLTWVGMHVAKPVADRHVKFLDDLTDRVGHQDRAMGEQTEAMKVIASNQARGFERLDDMTALLKEMLDQLKASRELK